MSKKLKRIQLLTMLGILLSANPKIVKANVDLSFLEISGNPEYIDDLIIFIQSLDDDLVTFLNQCNFRAIIMGENNSAEDVFYQINGYYPGSITGVAVYDNMDNYAIYVEGSKHLDNYPDIGSNYTIDELNSIIVKDTFIHEIGHFIDIKMYDFISEKSEFNNIYLNEVNSFMNTDEYRVNVLGVYQNINCSHEYFATAFAGYFCDKDNLKKYCPLTFDFMERVMADIRSNVVYYDDFDVLTSGSSDYYCYNRADISVKSKGLKR